MDIRINGEDADITLESERTVGAFLRGIENWLGNSEFRVNGLEIDGEMIPGNAIPLTFERELTGVRSIDVKVCTRQELMLEALTEARCYLTALTNPESGTPAASSLAESWKNSAAASFLSVELPDIRGILDALFGNDGAGNGTSPAVSASLLDERIREIGDPVGEFTRIESMVSALSERLEELPVDIQTGKDGRAAETVTLFSQIAEKIFRLFFIFQSRGKLIDTVDSVPIYDFLGEFGTAVKEILAAYSNKDSVLVGDLAEYELAPRLRAFYTALKRPIVSLV
jgi:hypothetical protein